MVWERLGYNSVGEEPDECGRGERYCGVVCMKAAV